MGFALVSGLSGRRRGEDEVEVKSEVVVARVGRVAPKKNTPARVRTCSSFFLLLLFDLFSFFASTSKTKFTCSEYVKSMGCIAINSRQLLSLITALDASDSSVSTSVASSSKSFANRISLI